MAVTDLTGTSWRFDDSISIFSADNYDIDFINNGKSYYSFAKGEGFQHVALGGWRESNGTNTIDYFYYTNTGWYSDNYKDITSTGGADIQDTTFINWLENNATQIKGSIAYNNTELAAVNFAQVATLECMEKKAATDIAISFFCKAGIIVYNDNKTVIEAGKTATLQCAGKKMLSDILVTIAKYALYNGERLPILPQTELLNTPYCFIRKNNSTGNYDLVFDIEPWSFSSNAINPASTSRNVRWFIVKIDKAGTVTGWDFSRTTTGGFGIDTNRTLLWANHDILKGSEIYLKGTEPVPVV